MLRQCSKICVLDLTNRNRFFRQRSRSLGWRKPFPRVKKLANGQIEELNAFGRSVSDVSERARAKS